MNISVRARIKTRRDLAKNGYGGLYDALHAILLKHNPASLDMKRGDARDDYGGPVGTLIPNLTAASEGNIRFLLEAEMKRWYGRESGESGALEAIAAEMWQAWVKFKSQNSVTTP